MMVTLTGAACSVGTAGTVGSLRDGTVVARRISGGMSGMPVPWRMIVNCLSVALWLLLSGTNDELADGFCSAVVMSVILASSRSMEDAVGMGTFVGNQGNMSHIHCAHVSM